MSEVESETVQETSDTSTKANPPKASLRSNFSWILGGNLVSEGVKACVLILLVKFGSAAIQGRFILFLSIVTPVSIFLTLGLRALFLTDAEEKYHFADYLRLRILSCFAIVVVSFLIGLSLTLSGKYNCEFCLGLSLFGLVKAAEFLSDLCYGVFQKKEIMKIIGLSRAFRAAILFPASFLALWLGGGLTGLLVTWVFIYAGIALLYDFPRAKAFYSIEKTFELKNILELVRQAIPLIFTTVFLTLNANVSQYVIAAYCSEKEIGYFGSINYSLVAFSLIFVAMGNALLPRMIQCYQNAPRSIWKLIGKGSVVVLVMAGLGFGTSYFLGEFVLELLFSAEHAKHVNVLWFLTATSAIIGYSSLVGYAATACRAFTPSAFMWGLVVGVTFVSGVFFIPEYGILGAAYANIASYVVSSILMTLIVVIYVAKRTKELANNPAENPA